MVIVNLKSWESLDDATRAVVMEKAKAAEDRGWEKASSLADWYKGKLAENGMTVGPAGDALSADFRKIGETMMKEWLERAGAKGQGVIDSYKKM